MKKAEVEELARVLHWAWDSVPARRNISLPYPPREVWGDLARAAIRWFDRKGKARGVVMVHSDLGRTRASNVKERIVFAPPPERKGKAKGKA